MTNLAAYAYTGRMIQILRCCVSLLTLFCLFFIISCSTPSHKSDKSIISNKSNKVPRTQQSYTIKNKRYYPIPSAKGYSEKGVASWYGGKFHGRRTSNGEVYDMYSMTAAHKTLPMNTMLLIKNLDNGKQTVVRINDRGPFVQGRIVDLSYKAANEIGIADKGVARVQAIALGEQAGNVSVNTFGKPPSLEYEDLSAGEFYVQIGAFTERPNAARLQKRFADAGHITVIQKDLGSEPMRYMVQVFAGKTMPDAKQAEKALLENGFVGSFIIAR